jgi:hypothetical protein
MAAENFLLPAELLSYRPAAELRPGALVLGGIAGLSVSVVVELGQSVGLLALIPPEDVEVGDVHEMDEDESWVATDPDQARVTLGIDLARAALPATTFGVETSGRLMVLPTGPALAGKLIGRGKPPPVLLFDGKTWAPRKGNLDRDQFTNWTAYLDLADGRRVLLPTSPERGATTARLLRS